MAKHLLLTALLLGSGLAHADQASHSADRRHPGRELSDRLPTVSINRILRKGTSDFGEETRYRAVER